MSSFNAPQTEHAFGAVLREERHSKGMTQIALSVASGCDFTYISKLERGLKSPTVRAVFALALALDTKPSEMLSKVEEMILE